MNDPPHIAPEPIRRGWQGLTVIGLALIVLGGGLWLWLAMSNNSGAVAARADRAPTPIISEAAPVSPVPVSPVPASSAPTRTTPTSPAPTSPAPPAPDSDGDSAEPVLIDTDLGTGSVEFSAVARNRETNRLIVADDQGQLFEFDLAPDGEPIASPRRTINVDVGAGDIEGVAWMSGTTYVIAHEDDGRLTVVTIDDETSRIGPDQLIRTIDTGIREEDGNGLEGVTYVGPEGPIEFAVVRERPPSVHLIHRNGEITKILLDLDLADVSDIWAAGDDQYWVLSDESRLVVRLEISASGTVNPLGQVSLQFDQGRFEQPEGVVGDGSGDLYIVGEDPGPGRFSFGLIPTE